MTLEELLNLLSDSPAGYFRVRANSKIIRPGDIFVAVKGTSRDGHNYIDDAISRGARYIVAQNCAEYTANPEQSVRTSQTNCDIITVPDSADALARLAQAAHQYPARKLTNLAVTGTNGKTTVAYLARSIIKTTGEPCGLVGTIIYDTGAAVTEAALTTPDAVTISELTAKMTAANTKYAVFEASSHSLDQKRLNHIPFRAAAFTNLSGDHLDYHHTMDEYLAAKRSLFDNLCPDSTAVLNKQSSHAEKIARKTKAQVLWYAVDAPADLSAEIETADASATCFSLNWAGRTEKIKTPLIGRHNVANHLAAAGLALAAGFDLQAVAKGLSALSDVPGRLQPVQEGQDFAVLIDYAHTDDALKNVLQTLRPLAKRRLIVVFGCGGDRDKTKRPRMAKVAETLADTIIVTSDNPRGEDPRAIISDIRKGFTSTGAENIFFEPDRKQAIRLAVQTARKDDILLIAGKGHEAYQLIGNRRIPFSDAQVARQIIGEIL